MSGGGALPGVWWVVLTAWAWLLPGSLLAQTVEGRVLDEEDERPVPTALVRLVDEGGQARAVTAADSTGRYRVQAPGPGIYRLQAERIGYEGMETPLLEMQRADQTYPVDLMVRRSPVPIRGLEVTNREVDRRLRLLIGISPGSLRWDPIRDGALRRHVEQAHDLTDVVRWGNYAGIEVRRSRDGPCYLVRRFGCMGVYLDGFRLTPGATELVSLDMLHTILVLGPHESLQYPSGAVLMYTRSWAR